MANTERTGTDAKALTYWHEVAQQLRIDSIRSTTQAGSGHATSSMSAADIVAVLFCKYLHYDFNDPKNPNNDHFILSKGHAAPLLYAAYKAAGVISDVEMMTLRQSGSRMEGHPTPILPWVEVATGSLGQGLPIGVGISVAGKYLDKSSYKTWVLMGDSEMAEGSVWEAFEAAGYYKLDNLVAIVDMNRLGQRGPTMLGWNAEAYVARAQAFSWNAVSIDGHNLDEIDRAYAEANRHTGTPTLIVARTIKGKGYSKVEDKEGWHGVALSEEMAHEAIQELGGERKVSMQVGKPTERQVQETQGTKQPLDLPRYELGSQVATRQAYGEALRALGLARSDLVVLDGEVSNSTEADIARKAFPERFFEFFIAEEQMVAAAVGLSVRNYLPFAATFAVFYTRALDFIRMAAISRANIKLCGSHAGTFIGRDGPSQMGLEDLSIMRTIFGSIVLQPCDANSTARLVSAMADTQAITYMRTMRDRTPVIYNADEEFVVGGCKILRQSAGDAVTVVATGVTVHEAIKAHDMLAENGVRIRVIDAYSVKPIDVDTLLQAARTTGGRVVTVEDHWSEGGLGDAVLDAFAGSLNTQVGELSTPRVIKLAVTHMPGSASPQEQLELSGISASHIAQAVNSLLV